MQILFINDYREKIGGAEIYMYLLKNELEKRGHSVTIFTSEVNVNEYVATIDHPSNKQLLRRIFNVSSYWNMKKLLTTYTPDIIHVHGIFNELSPSLLVPLGSYPVVMTVHNDQIVSAFMVQKLGRRCKKLVCPGCFQCVGPKGTVYEYLKRSIHSLLLSRINLFISPSQYMKGILEEQNFGPTVLLSNSISPLSFSKVSTFTDLLFIGRLTEGKGIICLVIAFAKLIKLHPLVHLTIVGNGPKLEEVIRLLSTLHIKKSVTILSSLSQEEAVTYYSKTSVVCVPSQFYDNLPTVCIEALYSGRALVGSNVGGIPEVIRSGYNGYLVPEGDPQALADALHKLFSSKKRIEEFGKHSLAISKKFNVTHHMIELLSLYTQVQNTQSQ